MSSMTFGRYTFRETFIHRLDARNKIFLMIIFMVGIFFQFNLWSTALLLSGFYVILLIVFMTIARINFLSLFKSLGGMWIFILLLMAIYIFIPNNNYYLPTAFTIGNVDVKWDAICQSAYIVMRLVLMLALTMILTSTTKPMDMTYAFEWYMRPLKPIHFPVNEISMTLSIALRFIPTLLDETDRIMKAQASRGIDFNHGGVFKRFGAIIALIIPLFVSALERSEELANAMIVRGYDPKAKRSKYRLLKFSYRDIFAFLLIVGLFGLIIYLSVIDTKLNPLDLVEIIFKVKGF
ncbi:MAG: energy-coupling factor transporter transmembrane protein EcfT [Erysipelotrichaceae bacterium]|jgi:energy-coupling factor transport system permease protein|nr:energy-coupling factor transporter transmembrane protein EcfT [Erysipelotrichaceae bacterium]